MNIQHANEKMFAEIEIVMEPTAIIERLEESLGLKTDRALAEFLGVAPSIISNWKTRGIANYDLIFAKCENIDLNYVIRGRKLEDSSRRSAENSLIYEDYCKKLEAQNQEYWILIKQMITANAEH